MFNDTIGYPTVKSIERPTETSASVFHIKRLDTASKDEEGSSRSIIDGLPGKLANVYAVN